MPIELLMPALSPTMTEGNLAKWLKNEGDKIKPGEVIAEIETDKATMEVEAVDGGILGKILVAAGTENVKVNELIALILEDGEDKSALDSYKPAAGGGVSAPVSEPKKDEPQAAASITAHPAVTTSVASGNRIFASPLAKRIAGIEGIDLGMVSGSGPNGRIVKDDVLKAKASGGAVSSKGSVASASVGRALEEFTKIPNNNMRKVIARRLTESKQQVPHFYLSIECELDKLLSMRKEMNDAAGHDNPKYKLSVNDFVIKAVALALRDVPAANASWSEEAVLQYNNVDVSVAVAIDGGLITPIIRNADQKSLSVLSNEMKGLVAKAKAGKLVPEEFQGGGFSISNLGMYGIKNFQAIINTPQACILAVGAGSERAVVKKGQLVIVNVMDVTLSVDHRVVDGAVGAQFLVAFKGYIENPVTMLV
jgi:pyruvate dehydrogenase E2 component (dihydrolipoamide acetyltransferase)